MGGRHGGRPSPIKVEGLRKRLGEMGGRHGGRPSPIKVEGLRKRRRHDGRTTRRGAAALCQIRYGHEYSQGRAS
jgi:hypothetical protein